MGGNQAMYDAGQMLQFLTDLAHKESEKKSVSTDDISMAVDEFETEMLPRAFNWVKKSGGDNFIVSSSDPHVAHSRITSP